MGNHEYYHGDWNKVEYQLLTQLPAGITLLNNQTEFYGGWHFVGAPLWASFDGANEAVMHRCQQAMSDYHVITNGKPSLKPSDTLGEHMDTVEWLQRCVPTLKGPVFMFTHHAPSKQSTQDNYRCEHFDGAYATDLEEFIRNNPNIKVWCHGHIHEARNYRVGDCNIISNPRGYVDYETAIGFDPKMEIDLQNYL